MTGRFWVAIFLVLSDDFMDLPPLNPPSTVEFLSAARIMTLRIPYFGSLGRMLFHPLLSLRTPDLF